MDTPVVFYTNPMSRGRIVRWMLEEIGCTYETRLLDYATSMKAPEYLAINPMGKVPAIQYKGVVVTETLAICAWLAEIFPEAALAPALSDQAARAAYHRWMFYIAGPLEAAITDKALGVEVPEDKRGSVGYGSYQQTLAVLEAALKEKDHLAGNSFSAADLVLSAYLDFYMRFGIVEKNPVFESYAQRHKGRPASLRADEIDNKLMAAGKT